MLLIVPVGVQDNRCMGLGSVSWDIWIPAAVRLIVVHGSPKIRSGLRWETLNLETCFYSGQYFRTGNEKILEKFYQIYYYVFFNRDQLEQMVFLLPKNNSDAFKTKKNLSKIDLDLLISSVLPCLARYMYYAVKICYEENGFVKILTTKNK